MTRSPPQAIDEPSTTDPKQFQQQGARPKTTTKHVSFSNPPWTMVTDSRRRDQEHTTDRPQDHGMSAAAVPEPPEEDWDEEPTLPTGLLDQGRTIDRATATEGDEA